MTGKDRMLCALRCERVDAPPFWELEFHLFDAFSGKKLVLGREFEKLTEKGKEAALGENAEIFLGVTRMLGFSAVTAPGGYWEVSPGEPAYYWLPAPYFDMQADMLRRAAGGEFLIVEKLGGLMGMPGAARYLEFSYKLFDAPDEIEEDARKMFAESRERLTARRDKGAECFVNPCDIADNKSIFFNPEQLERFFLQFLRPWTEMVADAGAYSILHTDGNVTAVLDTLADTKLHALQAIDPVAGMDIVAAKRTVADRLCLCGNVDCGLLELGTPEDVTSAAAELLGALGNESGFVLGSSNALQNTIPKTNYEALVAAHQAWENGAE